MEISRISETCIKASYLTDNSHFIQIRDEFNKALSKLKKENVVQVDRDCNTEHSRITFFEKYFKWIPVNHELVERLQKDESISDNLREEGNARFRSGSLLEALRSYNLAICFAPIDSLSLCLGYSNRSALFLKINEWKSCLDDINRVRTHWKFEKEVSQDIKKKLNLREQKCNDMLKTKEGTEKVWEGQRLNNQLRQISNHNQYLVGAENSVKMEFSEKAGRKLVATSEIPTGSLILRDLPYFIIPERLLTWETEFCSTCLCPLLGGIPHPVSTFPLFCNEQCLSSWKMPPHTVLTYLHQTTELRELILPLTIVYNYNLSRSDSKSRINESTLQLDGGHYDPVSFKSTYNLIAHRQDYNLNSSSELPNEFKAIFLSRLVSELPETKVKVDPELLLRLMENLPYNAINLFCYRFESHVGFHCNHNKALNSTDISFRNKPNESVSSMVRMPYACGVFNLVALCNNSCDPNAVFYKNVRSPEALLLSSRRINEGEEICISYKTHWSRMDFSERQEWFKQNYKFQCECDPCCLKLDERHLKDELATGEDANGEKLKRHLEGIHDDLEQVVELMETGDWSEAWKSCIECVEILSKSQVDKQWRLKVIAEDLLRQIIVQLAMQ